MKRGKVRSGFSLVEVIIAGGLSTFLFIALLSLQKTVLLAQQKDRRIRKLSSDSLYAIELIKSTMRRASVLVEPCINGSSDRLFGYVNVNPLDLSGRLVQVEPQEYFLYCFDQSSGAVYKYTGGYPPTLSFEPFYCGKPPGASQTREMVAGGMENAVVNYFFLRDPDNSAVINISYSFTIAGDTVAGDTAVSIRKSL